MTEYQHKYAQIYDKLNGQPHLQDLIKEQYYSILEEEDRKIYEEQHQKNTQANLLNLQALNHLWSIRRPGMEWDVDFNKYIFGICRDFKYDCYNMMGFLLGDYIYRVEDKPMGDFEDRRMELERNANLSLLRYEIKYGREWD